MGVGLCFFIGLDVLFLCFFAFGVDLVVFFGLSLVWGAVGCVGGFGCGVFWVCCLLVLLFVFFFVVFCVWLVFGF